MDNETFLSKVKEFKEKLPEIECRRLLLFAEELGKDESYISNLSLKRDSGEISELCFNRKVQIRLTEMIPS